MAKKTEATLLINIKEKGAKVLAGIRSSLSTMVGATKLAGAAFGALGAAVGAAAIKAGKFEGVQNSFIKLAQSQGQVADEMLSKMRELSQGTISDLKLMEQANTAALLGLPVDKMGQMMETAMAASKATGQSMEFMLQSITTGLGRQSKLILDNLGIVFSAEQANKNYAKSMNIVGRELTDAEKKQAFINEALRIGSENAKKMGASGLTVAQMWEKVQAQTENAVVAIGQSATPIIQHFGEQVLQMFDSFNSAANQSTLMDFFQHMGKMIVVIKNMFISAGETIGTVVGAMGLAFSRLMKGEFKRAGQALSLGWEELGNISKNHWERTGQEMEAIDMKYSQARVERAKTEAAAKLEVHKAAEEEKAAFDEEAFNAKMERQFAQTEMEIELIGADEQRKLDLKLQYLETQIQGEADFNKRRALMNQKSELLEQKRTMAMTEFQKMEQQKRLQAWQSTLGQISSLQSAKSKELVFIGKAAAIANIIISTQAGMMKAYAQLGAFGAPMAALIGAAGAASAAQVAGVALAEGGIVPATPGGIQATIGEGGRSEAVIPLPDDFDPDSSSMGGGNTFVFNGPVLGDSTQAREFALMLDEEFYKLRKGGESIAFDSGIS